ncbi:hypothetical protein BV25DRAFT_1531711 [Artomyces pyxidatus]|uniref:Uncharacterized protein n=1 Tax=Artomyces pyxidatus TaxID=48021 RepID=A0ACB8TBT4_9AGAM|nr:hypothetical protein BV25DRAFT_1531711 [Artomyces pyxidatus]
MPSTSAAARRPALETRRRRSPRPRPPPSQPPRHPRPGGPPETRRPQSPQARRSPTRRSPATRRSTLGAMPTYSSPSPRACSPNLTSSIRWNDMSPYNSRFTSTSPYLNAGNT